MVRPTNMSTHAIPSQFIHDMVSATSQNRSLLKLPFALNY
jgi:hypothetical protein